MIGLSVAVRLREAGADAHVVAAERGLDTTSSVAAALWYPYRAFPHDRVTRWASETYVALAAIAKRDPDAGVRLVPGREFVREPGSEPGGGRRTGARARRSTGSCPRGTRMRGHSTCRWPT